MFFKLILENSNGDRVDMTTTANQYMTSRVEGLNPPTGTISTSSYAEPWLGKAGAAENGIGVRDCSAQHAVCV